MQYIYCVVHSSQYYSILSSIIYTAASSSSATVLKLQTDGGRLPQESDG